MFSTERRSDYDVTNSVQVTSTQDVANAACEIVTAMFPGQNISALKQAFDDFERLFEGEYKGYHACDTFYHDKQHTLDMTLALARLIEGYQRSATSEDRFPLDYVIVGLITALYHDSGYIRELDDENINGAIYTLVHVSRSADFLSRYLPMVGLEQYAPVAANIVHYTGYELHPSQITLPEKRLHTLGYMLGSADLIAQMSDRCYLEKCRDRLFPEFVLGNVAERKQDDGSVEVIYESGNDLLKKTPMFYQSEIKQRLKNLFRDVYHYAENHFGNSNHYIDALEENQVYLHKLLEEDKLNDLKRIPLQNNGTIYAMDSTAEEIRRLKIK